MPLNNAAAHSDRQTCWEQYEMQQLSPFRSRVLLFLLVCGVCACTRAGRSVAMPVEVRGQFSGLLLPFYHPAWPALLRGPLLAEHLSGPGPFHVDIFLNDNC